MRPVSEWDRTDLDALVATLAEEGASLEFKASPALANTNANKAELVKDVCGFANAAGGTIVYGIVENADGVATRIDDGAPTTVTQEWIEQVISSNIEPQVSGVTVRRIPLANGAASYAIHVPKATVFAPHQSKIEQRYYRRWGRITQRMYDHEIRDLMRRADTPELYSNWHIRPAGDQHRLVISIGNRSNAPALYGMTTIFFDAELQPPEVAKHQRSVEATLSAPGGERPAIVYSRNFAVPHHLPIFSEQEWAWFECLLTIRPDATYRIGCAAICPGFKVWESGEILRVGQSEPEIRLAINNADAPRTLIR